MGFGKPFSPVLFAIPQHRLAAVAGDAQDQAEAPAAPDLHRLQKRDVV
jgi:hypothetical protein